MDQLSWASRARVRLPTGSTSCPARLGPFSEALKCRPAVPGDSGPDGRACSVDQPSWATQAHSRGPASSSNCPRQLGTVPEGPGAKELSRATRTFFPSSPQGQPAVLSDSGPCLRAHAVDQVSRATRVRARGLAVLNSCPGGLRPRSDSLRCQPSTPGDSGPGPRARRVDQLSWEIWDLVVHTAVSSRQLG